MTRLLVTGFGPFPTMPRNPSAALARAVAASPRLRLHGIEAEVAILTTAYAALTTELDPLLGGDVDVVLLLGVAGRSHKVRVECQASPRRSTLFPDASGLIPGATSARQAIRRTSVNTTAALRGLSKRGVPARLSRSAGRYLCNSAYFRALAWPRPTLFIHVPKPPRRGRRGRTGWGRGAWNAGLPAGLVDVAIALAAASRRPIARRP